MRAEQSGRLSQHAFSAPCTPPYIPYQGRVCTHPVIHHLVSNNTCLSNVESHIRTQTEAQVKSSAEIMAVDLTEETRSQKTTRGEEQKGEVDELWNHMWHPAASQLQQKVAVCPQVQMVMRPSVLLMAGGLRHSLHQVSWDQSHDWGTERGDKCGKMKVVRSHDDLNHSWTFSGERFTTLLNQIQ